MRKLKKEQIQEAFILTFNAAWGEYLESTDNKEKIEEMCKKWKEKTIELLQEKYLFSIDSMSRNDKEELKKDIKNGLAEIFNFFVK